MPVTQPRLARAKDAARLFDEIRRGDILVHQPYESFRTSFEAFAAAAADDPDVIAMKTAVYRTSDDSTLVSALIDCAEDGKQAVCLVELKARFDERRNIEWSRELEQAGVHVVHGFPDMKIHAKMTLVVRREAGGLRRYVHIGTGNYHAVDGAPLRGRRALHGRRGDRGRRRRRLQLRHGLRPPAAVPQAARGAVRDADAAVEEIRGVAAAAEGRRDGADPAQAQQPRRPDDDRRAVRRLGGGREHRHLRPVDLHAPARASRASRRTSACARSWAASSSTAASTRSRRATATCDVHRQRRPDAAQPRPPGRGARPRSRARARGRSCRRSSTASSPTTSMRGCSRATAPGRRSSRRSRASASTTRRR